MKSYSTKAKKEIETPKEVVSFLTEIERVCKKYGYSISHEDGHGSFIITAYNEDDMDSLKHANLE